MAVQMEDLAIAYGFNDLPRSSPNQSVTLGKPLMINKLSDIVREECAMAGWSEVMPLILCSHEENFEYLNRKDDGKTVVRLANPKTVEYQVVRTSLLPGLLKTLSENKAVPLPVKIFEASDVVFKDESLERQARNERHWAAAYCGKTSGFEVVHGLLDRVMKMLQVSFLTHEEALQDEEKPGKKAGYFIKGIDDPTFFNGRAAAIYVRLNGKLHRIGELGILHPTVLDKFDLRYDVMQSMPSLELVDANQVADTRLARWNSTLRFSYETGPQPYIWMASRRGGSGVGHNNNYIERS
jgi:phenylalanyl-tRNA synthetase beta chain